jgi:hypothetical protein
MRDRPLKSLLRLRSKGVFLAMAVVAFGGLMAGPAAAAEPPDPILDPILVEVANAVESVTVSTTDSGTEGTVPTIDSVTAATQSTIDSVTAATQSTIDSVTAATQSTITSVTASATGSSTVTGALNGVGAPETASATTALGQQIETVTATSRSTLAGITGAGDALTAARGGASVAPESDAVAAAVPRTAAATSDPFDSPIDPSSSTLARRGGGGANTPAVSGGEDRPLASSVAELLRTVRDGFLPAAGRGDNGYVGLDEVTDNRLLMQIGMALGTVYLAFLVVWFWATRVRSDPWI